jgi:predicted cobalt transporter CbtA
MMLGATLTPTGKIIGESLVLIEVQVLPGFFMKPITFFQFCMFLSFAFGLYSPETRRRMMAARPGFLRTVYIGAWLVAMGSGFEIIYQIVLWSAALAVQGLANPDVIANPFPVSVNPTPINVVFASKVIVAIFFMSAFLIDYIQRIDRRRSQEALLERVAGRR